MDSAVWYAWDEVLRLLRDNLPATITRWNTAKGWNVQTPPQENFRIAPAVVTDTYINCIIVAASVRTEPFPPGRFKNVATFTIYSIGERVEIEEQVNDHYRLAGMIRGILRPCMTNWFDPDGVHVWDALIPMGVTNLPGSWGASYSGVTIPYTSDWYPGQGGWG